MPTGSSTPARADALSAALLDGARNGAPIEPIARALVAVDPAALDIPARAAFWINLYNAAVKHAIRTRGMRGSLLVHRGFFRSVAWEVGGHRVNLHEIEHGLLRGNRPAPWTFWRPLRAADPRLSWGVPLDPRVHFALNCGARSCPPIRAYTADKLDAQLALATRAYLDGEVVIEGERLRAPWLCKLYRTDFGDLHAFLAAHTDDATSAWIRAHPDAALRWGPYRWEIEG
jgi:hypothetical protein